MGYVVGKSDYIAACLITCATTCPSFQLYSITTASSWLQCQEPVLCVNGNNSFFSYSEFLPWTELSSLRLVHVKKLELMILPGHQSPSPGEATPGQWQWQLQWLVFVVVLTAYQPLVLLPFERVAEANKRYFIFWGKHLSPVFVHSHKLITSQSAPLPSISSSHLHQGLLLLR